MRVEYGESDGLKWLSGEVDKPEFHKNVEGFIESIGKLVTSVGGLVHSLASWARWLGVSHAHAAVNPRSATGAGPGGVAPPGPGGSTGEGNGKHGSGHNATRGPCGTGTEHLAHSAAAEIPALRFAKSMRLMVVGSGKQQTI